MDFANANMKAEVNNAFDESTVLDQLTDNYMKLRLNGKVSVEMRLRKVDSLLTDSSSFEVFVVTTYRSAESQHSKIERFTAKWMPLPYDLHLDKRVGEMVERKPQTTDEEWQMVVAAMDNVSVVAGLSSDSDSLSLSPSFSMLTTDEKTILNDKITLKILNINL